MSKKTQISALLLVILASISFGLAPMKERLSRRSAPKNILAFESDSLDKIEITDAGKVTTLIKSDKRWKIDGTKDFYANGTAMQALIDSLKSAKSGRFELVSRNKSKKDGFGLDGSLKAKLWSGNDPVGEFEIGKPGPDYQSSYVSLPGQEQTYLVSGNLSSIFSREDWRDRQLFTADKSSIKKLRFHRAGKEYAIILDGDKWKSADKKIVLATDKVDLILSALVGLSASGIPDQDFKASGLNKDSFIIEAGGDAESLVLMVGAKNATGEYYAKKGDSDNIYLIDAGVFSTLDKKLDDLR